MSTSPVSALVLVEAGSICESATAQAIGPQLKAAFLMPRARNFVCGPVLDISQGSEYDISSPPMLEWLIHTLETQRLRSLMVEVPCATMSMRTGRRFAATGSR